jgi:hypothetical protein
LLRIGEVALDLLPESELEGGVPLLRELRDLDLLFFEQVGLPIDHALLLRDHRVACGQIVREHELLRHSRI